jgi:hypothetical protein
MQPNESCQHGVLPFTTAYIVVDRVAGVTHEVNIIGHISARYREPFDLPNSMHLL